MHPRHERSFGGGVEVAAQAVAERVVPPLAQAARSAAAGQVVAAIGVQMSAGRYLREERQVRERVLGIVREAEERV